ncbi:MAG: sigma-70 family RNA polymerase sigma factor [Bacillota bacterium]|nr:sigma-70 family RNA polymerase sigma factor [Bacillota bacterium]
MSKKQNEHYKQLIEYIKSNQENIYRFAYRYVKNEQDALDVVQEAVYKAVKSIDGLEKTEYYKTWFYRIVINTSLTYIKKNKKYVLTDSVISETVEAPNQAENIDLYNAIEGLKDDYKSIITLRYFADMKIEDIASITNLNINTVKTRLYKALKILKIQVEERV